MATLAPVPKWRAFDASGDPLSGGKLYAYAAGTSTAKDTYTSSTGGTANANPVILDANGEANVWLNGNYKLVLKNSADVTQWTVDNIVGQDTPYGYVSVTDYGAVGDGVTDDTASIQAALTAGAKAIYFPPGTYLVSSTLTITASNTLLTGTGATIYFTGTGDTLLEATGTEGSAILLSADGTVEATTLTLASVGGLAVDDLVRISSTDTFASTSTANYTASEHQYIESIDTGAGTITLYEGLWWGSYQTASAASVKKITPINYITIENLKFLGTGAGDNQQCMNFTRCQNIKIRNVYIKDFETRGIGFFQSFHCDVSASKFINVAKDGYGYGVSITQGSQWVTVHHNTFQVIRHAVTAGGVEGYVTRFFTVDGNHIYGATDAGLDTHSAAQFFAFTNNTISNKNSDATGDGIIAQGTDGVITGNQIISSGREGIFVQCNTDSVSPRFVISNNKMYSVDGNGIQVATTRSAGVSGMLIITDNIIKGTGAAGIILNTINSDIAGAVVSGNDISSTTTHGIYLYANAQDIMDVTITANVVKDTTLHGIYLLTAGGGTCTRVVINGNVCRTSAVGTTGILGTGTDYINTVNNITEHDTGVSVAGAGSAAANNIAI